MDVGSVLLAIGLGAVAILGRHIALYIAAFAGLLVFGLQTADTYLTTGIAVCLMAGYFLWRAFETWLGR